MLLSVICPVCNGSFLREARWVNENVKLHYPNYCSHECFKKSKLRQSLLICDNRECQRKFLRVNNKTVSPHFCSQACANKIIGKNLRKVKKCIACGNLFYGKNEYCSLKCVPRTPPRYTMEILINKIQLFFREKGRVPYKREFNSQWQCYRRVFGSWNSAISAAGFSTNPARFSQKYFAKDGHKCDSLSEKIIDDWLSARKILHTRNVRYPGQSKFTVDFLVENKYWVEFFGLLGQLDTYSQLYKRKMLLAKKSNINIVSLFPADIFPVANLSQKLGFLLK